MKREENDFDNPLHTSDEDLLLEDLKQVTARRSYRSRKELKRLIDEKFRIVVDALDIHFDNVDAEAIGYTGKILSRRKTAVQAYVEKAIRDCPEAAEQMVSIEEAIVGFEAGPSRTSYSGLNIQEYTLVAAAMWILDDLKKNSRLHEAYKFLPKDYDDIIDMDIPTSFYDPCYEEDLIRSVMSVIYNRNSRPGKESVFGQEFDNPYDATGRRPGSEESEYRKNFESLMELIDPEHARKAGDTFKDKAWDALKRFIDAMLVLDRQDSQAIQRVRQCGASRANILVVNPRAASSEEDMVSAMKDAVDVINETEQVRKKLDVCFEDFIGMDVKEIRNEIGSVRAARKVAGFSIDDPYEICFGLLYLLDQGDDAPWMFHLGYCVLWNAVKLLPWFKPFDEIADEDLEDLDYGVLTYDQGGWIQRQETYGTEDKTDYYHERVNGQNLAQILFKLTGAVMPRNLHPFEDKRKELKEYGMDEVLVDKVIAEAEIFFLTQFQSGAANLVGRSWFGFESDMETDAEDGEALSPDEAAEGHTESDEIATEKKANANEKRLKDEIKSLRKSLSEMSRQAAREKAEYEKEIAALRREHRELADLRELVFNQENDTGEGRPEEPGAAEIEFPYETQKRTVVFGGHETFLKQFRPKFTNVRFVDVERSAFSPDLVRNADIVWVQNNRISHSQYYRIINITRQYGIQVRYFPYGSADKCAEVLVREDRKG